MKLTNSHREAFIRSVMHDVPKHDYEQQLKDALQGFLRHQAPAEVQALYDNPMTRKYISRGSASVYRTNVGYSDMWFVPNDDDYYGRPNFRLEMDKMANSPALGVLKALIEQRDKQKSEREALEAKLRQTIFSLSTVKQAHDLMPEFAKYLPEIVEKTKQLPAVANLVSDLNKAGWKIEEKK